MNRNDFYEEYDFDSHENKVRIAAVIGTLVVTVVFGVGGVYNLHNRCERLGQRHSESARQPCVFLIARLVFCLLHTRFYARFVTDQKNPHYRLDMDIYSRCLRIYFPYHRYCEVMSQKAAVLPLGAVIRRI